jgi:hypothetical protein
MISRLASQSQKTNTSGVVSRLYLLDFFYNFVLLTDHDGLSFVGGRHLYGEVPSCKQHITSHPRKVQIDTATLFLFTA